MIVLKETIRKMKEMNSLLFVNLNDLAFKKVNSKEKVKK